MHQTGSHPKRVKTLARSAPVLKKPTVRSPFPARRGGDLLASSAQLQHFENFTTTRNAEVDAPDSPSPHVEPQFGIDVEDGRSEPTYVLSRSTTSTSPGRLGSSAARQPTPQAVQEQLSSSTHEAVPTVSSTVSTHQAANIVRSCGADASPQSDADSLQ